MKLSDNLKKGDFFIILVVLVLAAAVFLPFALAPSRSLTCEITKDGELVKRVRLGAGYHETITLEGAATNTIIIDDAAVYFSQSTCPDQVCVRTGKLTRAGQIAVCLPNRVIVRLIGAQNEIDALAT
ncbi:MAG: NusG domain II-containing protein [Butyricicoccus pullicaecorum]|nr:NusG domain II-containing protein [Butyricicoccus pullicaecorum]